MRKPGTSSRPGGEGSPGQADDPFEEFFSDVSTLARTVVIALAVAFVAIALLGIFSLKLYLDLRELVDERIAEQKVANEAAVDACFARAAQAPALGRTLQVLAAQNPEQAAVFQNLAAIIERGSVTFRECRRLAQGVDVPIPNVYPRVIE